MIMTVLEGITGLLASSIAIMTALAFAVRYMGRKFDKWIDVVVENSSAMRHLTDRVSTLEGSVKTLESVITVSGGKPS